MTDLTDSRPNCDFVRVQHRVALSVLVPEEKHMFFVHFVRPYSYSQFNMISTSFNYSRTQIHTHSQTHTHTHKHDVILPMLVPEVKHMLFVQFVRLYLVFVSFQPYTHTQIFPHSKKQTYTQIHHNHFQVKAL